MGTSQASGPDILCIGLILCILFIHVKNLRLYTWIRIMLNLVLASVSAAAEPLS